MPASLRWLGFLVGIALVAAILSGAGLYLETRARTRILAETASGGDVARGHAAIVRYGCGACHRIAGIPSAEGDVGPSLNGIARRTEIAGHLVNEPAPMIRWLRHPQAIAPGNGMPEQGVTESDARDMAAYLYTLKSAG